MSRSIEASSFCRTVRIGELEAIEVTHPLFFARLFTQGAHLTHVVPAGQDNLLWMSDTAQFTTGKAIRGGIPICWPWFGDADRNPEPVATRIGSEKAHGFARTADWSFRSVTESDSAVEIELTLDASAITGFGDWPLMAVITFRFTECGCELSLTTTNMSETSTAFTQALHSYLPTPSIDATSVSGFDGVQYVDTLDEWREFLQDDVVVFKGETDRIYKAGGQASIHTPAGTIWLSATGSQSTVIWNPGPEKAARLSDFPDTAWRTMLCVESANALTDYVDLKQGQSHRLNLSISRQ
ncbi:D-hexose-6-phosphate mutarotase [Marinobacter sp. BGYM27]|uniref:D-hexose-6-phosphate mutarotase n=1 Tax=Marinobacter sp. BGYM27 TaxID=2975597 RepID=UPI0021A5037D|nr:D-hexose-6-phosphate mutarotase [Marinobacter sp. BGYM27]MDG5499028.1 D-hexose-6-phosphate mutarotase [Marinobacter sp. BGYM27]